jgi:hypothetical protein
MQPTVPTHLPTSLAILLQATDRSAKALKYKAADGSVISFREVSSRQLGSLLGPGT